MDQVSTLERVFSYKAKANEEILMTMRQFDDASPAKEIAIRVLNHTYAVDRIFAANLRQAEHGYTSPNPSQAPSLEELFAAIKTTDQRYIEWLGSFTPSISLCHKTSVFGLGARRHCERGCVAGSDSLPAIDARAAME